MRTDARIFRAASPLGLGRCWLGGGGCRLCRQTQTRPVPNPLSPGRVPAPNPLPLKCHTAPSAGQAGEKENGRNAAGSASPSGTGYGPVHSLAGLHRRSQLGPCPSQAARRLGITHNCAQPLRPFSASPGKDRAEVLSPKTLPAP